MGWGAICTGLLMLKAAEYVISPPTLSRCHFYKGSILRTKNRRKTLISKPQRPSMKKIKAADAVRRQRTPRGQKSSGPAKWPASVWNVGRHRRERAAVEGDHAKFRRQRTGRGGLLNFVLAAIVLASARSPRPYRWATNRGPTPQRPVDTISGSASRITGRTPKSYQQPP
jgi:hypothetical protein